MTPRVGRKGRHQRECHTKTDFGRSNSALFGLLLPPLPRDPCDLVLKCRWNHMAQTPHVPILRLANGRCEPDLRFEIPRNPRLFRHSTGHKSSLAAPNGTALSARFNRAKDANFAQLKHGFFHQNKGKPPFTRQCSGVVM